MKRIIGYLLTIVVVLFCYDLASAYGHANRFGGSSSHSFGSSSHSNRWGGDTSHTAGEGTSHSNAYGGGTSHAYGGGTSHTNVYGGTTAGAYGAGAVHTGAYGGTAYAHPQGYYGYHPPAAVPYYGAQCYNCGHGWAAAATGAIVGATTTAAVMSAQSSAAASNAYNQGYSAGTSQSNAAASNAYAEGYHAGAATAYSMGQVVMTLPGGCISPAVSSGGTYYLCGNTWLRPSYGANGLYYKVVSAP